MTDKLTYEQCQKALRNAKAKYTMGLITYKYYIALKKVLKKRMRGFKEGTE